jgi:hypothetical protein
MRTVRVLMAALVALLCAPAGALAHGDPSVHYLETGSFYPGSETQSEATQLQLLGLLNATEKAGYPIKVSIVGGEIDVPDMPEMVKHPQRYAEYVTTALRDSRVPLVGPVVIVTPNGIGVAGPGAEQLDITPAAADRLDAAAITAVRRLAEAGGHPLPANVPPMKVPVLAPKSSSGGPGYDLSGLTPFAVFIAIFGSAVVYLQIRTRLARRRVPTPQL